jgi:hypothetical protein
MGEEIPSEAAEDRAAVADADGSNAAGGAEFAFMDDKGGASGHRVADKAMTVRLKAGDRHKEAALAALP